MPQVFEFKLSVGTSQELTGSIINDLSIIGCTNLVLYPESKSFTVDVRCKGDNFTVVADRVTQALTDILPDARVLGLELDACQEVE